MVTYKFDTEMLNNTEHPYIALVRILDEMNMHKNKTTKPKSTNTMLAKKNRYQHINLASGKVVFAILCNLYQPFLGKFECN